MSDNDNYSRGESCGTCEGFSVNAPESAASFKKGHIVRFGSYSQGADGHKLPIEWLVLDSSGNEALLISRHGLDCMPYHRVWDDITWENCDLRKWLNSDFLKEAFSEEDIDRIKISELRNGGHFLSVAGTGTRVRVFCLSIAEAEQYFGDDDEERQCRPTKYAENRGTFADDSSGCCYWWLRSPGFYPGDVSHVLIDGMVSLDGCYVADCEVAVRPALRIICEKQSADLTAD